MGLLFHLSGSYPIRFVAIGLRPRRFTGLPLMGTLQPQSNGEQQYVYSNTVIGTWSLMGRLLHLVPNITAHPSTACVPTTYIRCSTIITFAL